jgi:chemotaxis protein MotB
VSSGRRKKNRETEDEGDSERWLLPYADFITLLMVFFIIMYAMSKTDLAKYNAIAQSLSIVLTGSAMPMLETPGPSLAPGLSGQQDPVGSIEHLINMGQLEEVQKMIEEFIRKDQLDKSGSAMEQTSIRMSDFIEILEQERGLVISIKDTLLFTSGSDALNPQAREIIRLLGGALVQIPNYIRVEGHTDNLPINTAKFPSNWELSVLRASNVVHVLHSEAGVSPDRLSVIGYGEYRPLVANLNTSSRATNRRVDIVILKTKYDDFESPRTQANTP